MLCRCTEQFFNQHTFKLEESVYREEKIVFAHVPYIDNQPVLDLIEKVTSLLVCSPHAFSNFC